jgi:ABC-type glycerol-3-phosphate transport system permease component
LNTYNNKIEKKRKISISAVHAVLIIISLCCVIPMFLIISASLTEEMAIIKNGYSFLPSKFMTDAYEVILKNPQQILRGYCSYGYRFNNRYVFWIIAYFIIGICDVTERLCVQKQNIAFYSYSAV